MIMIITRVLLLILLVSGILSCSAKNMMLDEMVGVIETGLPAFEQESDLELLEKAFPANIKLLETMLASRPANDRLLTLLSRMYAGYAFAFFEGRLDEARLAGSAPGSGKTAVESIKGSLNRYYLKGKDYALQALEVRHPECRKDLLKAAAVQPFLERLSKKDLPALFWYGFNLGAYVNQNRDSMRAIAQAYQAEMVMQRVLQLDETYYNSSAHLFMMNYYASRPPMMGGKPEKALRHYKQLKMQAGESFLLADLYYARYYLYRMQKRQAFEDVLERVVRHPTDDTYPFLNAVAAERARIYLHAADQLFE